MIIHLCNTVLIPIDKRLPCNSSDLMSVSKSKEAMR